MVAVVNLVLLRSVVGSDGRYSHPPSEVSVRMPEAPSYNFTSFLLRLSAATF